MKAQPSEAPQSPSAEEQPAAQQAPQREESPPPAAERPEPKATPEDLSLGAEGEGAEPLTAEEERRRRRLLVVLAVLLLALCGVVYLFVRYLNRPEPLPELLPVPVEMNYPPHYLFSFYDVNAPLGIALAPAGDRVYVTESEGDRLIKMFDPDGNFLRAFAPPRTTEAERSPVYVATDLQGRVYVTDRLQHAIFVFDPDGHYLDTILGPDLTLSEYIAKHAQIDPRPGTFAYDLFEGEVHYQDAQGKDQTLPSPGTPEWAPLGVAFDAQGRLLVTDVWEGRHRVLVFPAEVAASEAWVEFAPPVLTFGRFGEAEDEFQFPNMALADDLGRFIVSDGNNGRLSVWNAQGEWLYLIGAGGGGGGLNLPRGMALDARQRLHVVDAVGQTVRVYDFSAEEPTFLYTFGTMGTLQGQFNYPNDIALDDRGRLYITDRANDRVQVWSY